MTEIRGREDMEPSKRTAAQPPAFGEARLRRLAEDFGMNQNKVRFTPTLIPKVVQG